MTLPIGECTWLAASLATPESIRAGYYAMYFQIRHALTDERVPSIGAGKLEIESLDLAAWGIQYCLHSIGGVALGDGAKAE